MLQPAQAEACGKLSAALLRPARKLMRLTRKFVVTLVFGIMLVLIASAFTRVEREIAFFDRDARHDATLVGAVIARAMDHVWRTEGEASALDLLEDVARRSRHWQIRFVWLDDQVSAVWRPALKLSELTTVAQGHPWSRRIESGEGQIFTYVPASPPGGRPAAIEIRE